MRIRLGWLGLGLWAASAQANLQLNFPLERLGTGDYNGVEFLSADALLEVDGVAVVRLAANQRVVGGSPVMVGLIWAYDSDPAHQLEELLNQGASVVLRDVQLRLSCPAGSPVLSWSRGVNFAYPYQLGTPFPVNLPAAMPVFDTLDCDTALEEGAAPQALSFALGEAQPNPFNPTTSLSYTLPASQDVTLRVYNPGGQLVRTLAQGRMPRGVHNVLFDASRLASGLYLCRLESDGRAVTRKILYLK